MWRKNKQGYTLVSGADLRAARRLRKPTISVVVIMVLFALAGVVYVFVSPGAPAAKPITVDKNSTASIDSYTLKPTPPGPNAGVGVSVGSLTTPVKAGANASINIRTTATAKCSIAVIYNNAASHDSGLAPKVADAYGIATWSWTVPVTTPAGSWPVKVRCDYHKRWAVVESKQQVVQ